MRRRVISFGYEEEWEVERGEEEQRLLLPLLGALWLSFEHQIDLQYTSSSPRPRYPTSPRLMDLCNTLLLFRLRLFPSVQLAKTSTDDATRVMTE